MAQSRWFRHLSTLQWFIFLVTNSIALPVVIGSLFQLSVEEVSSLMQRTFFVVGISTLLQGWLGHRYPVADGPAGSWVSVFVILADVSLHQGTSAQETLQLFTGALLVAGILLLFLGLTGLVERIAFLFTPLVTGSFLLLLTIQLSGVFLKGMLGVQGTGQPLDLTQALLACGVFALVLILSIKGRGWVKNYAVLIGILVGWLVFALLGKSSTSLTGSTALFQLPEMFAWGLPKLNAGIVFTAMLFTLTLVSNTIAAVSAVGQVVPRNEQLHQRSVRRGSWAGGFSHLFASSFSTIGVVPLPVSAGFIRLTGQTQTRPFLIACLLLSGVAFLPWIVNFLALLPGTVASAVLLANFVQLVGISFQSLLRDPLDQRRLSILGITLLIGAGLMAVPPAAFQQLPSLVQYVVTNGLLVGTLIVILLEQLWKEKR
ncbi:purine/pyrimidine permease [Tumebacillus lipolyticus]|uniref:Purine/pyrimidine permease n=1 Tax=Tumebacillus lipolyticus TaxID=1280370 RepID=A0ABW4ZWX8_9BACL